MAKSTAERQKEYKANRKQLNCFVSELAYQSLADLAAERGKTKIEILESLLLGNNTLLGNDNLQSEIEALKAELATAKANNERLVLKYDAEHLRANELENQNKELKRQPDNLRAELDKAQLFYESSVEARGELLKENRRLSAELATANAITNDTAKPYHQSFADKKLIAELQKENEKLKAQILELQNSTSEPKHQRETSEPKHQRETSEPLNLIPDKVFKYDYYGSDRLIALLADDSRVFFKDTGKRWELFVNANSSHFSEREGRFYFGKTEIYLVENFKGKIRLKSSLVCRLFERIG